MREEINDRIKDFQVHIQNFAQDNTKGVRYILSRYLKK